MKVSTGLERDSNPAIHSDPITFEETIQVQLELGNSQLISCQDFVKLSTMNRSLERSHFLHITGWVVNLSKVWIESGLILCVENSCPKILLEHSFDIELADSSVQASQFYAGI